jgi:hypothetical protein
VTDGAPEFTASALRPASGAETTTAETTRIPVFTKQYGRYVHSDVGQQNGMGLVTVATLVFHLICLTA